MQVSEKISGVAASGGQTAPPASKEGMQGANVRYMEGDAEPVTSSVLISNSKYLNNPYYRDVFAQIGLRRYGHDLPTTYMIPKIAKALAEVTDFAEFVGLIEAEKKIKAEFADWLSARRYTVYRREDLQGMAPGTLGHAIWELLGIPGIEMELHLSGVEITNDIDYLAKRRGANHDIEHIVTGFGPNAAGELALGVTNITTCAAYFTPELAHQINAGIVMINSVVLQRTSLHYPAAVATILEATRLGIEMGQALKRPLLIEPWEDMLDWRLEDIAKHLGIVPGPGKAWDWTTAATTG